MAINKLSVMKEKEQIRQSIESIVKNNIFMLKRLGIDLESPNCIVDLFNSLVLFVEASEENRNAARLLENPFVNDDYEDEVRYGVKEPDSDVGCSKEYCCKEEDVTNG